MCWGLLLLTPSFPHFLPKSPTLLIPPLFSLFFSFPLPAFLSCCSLFLVFHNLLQQIPVHIPFRDSTFTVTIYIPNGITPLLSASQTTLTQPPPVTVIFQQAFPFRQLFHLCKVKLHPVFDDITDFFYTFISRKIKLRFLFDDGKNLLSPMGYRLRIIQTFPESVQHFP